MSLSKDGKTISCDGPGPVGAGCLHTMSAPVGLHQFLRPGAAPPVNGWLCVMGNEETRHFCADCAGGYLASLSPVHMGQRTEWIGEENEAPQAQSPF